MKKNIIISIIAVILVLIMVVISFVLFNKNKVVSTIKLDINPSIEINLNNKEKVISIVALNDDAKNIVNSDLEGISLDKALDLIVERVIDKGYVDEEQVVIITYSNGKISNDKIDKYLQNNFEDKNISVDIIRIDKITKEDEEISKKYNITSAKVSYIKLIMKENKNISFEDLAKRSANELKEIKETGKHCDTGYTLKEDWCIKEINRVLAETGNVCPKGYTEFEGKCYEETRAIETGSLSCFGDFSLKDEKCIRDDSYKAEGDCGNGHYLQEEDMCEIEVIVGDAYEFCRDSGRSLYDHKCLATKPTINGGCLNGDMLYNGKCVNTRNDFYYSEWKCPDGRVLSNDNGELLYPDKKCREWQKIKPSSYKCNDDYTLEGTTCTRTVIEKAYMETFCPSGFTKTEQGRCINLNNIKDYVTGFVCNKENSRIDGKECIIYEKIEAKK